MIRQVSPLDPMIIELILELNSITGNLYPKESTFQDSPEELLNSNVFMVAYFVNDRPVAIGALKPFDGYGELKRMYVKKQFRNKGYAEVVLRELEEYGLKNNVHVFRLETGIKQISAIRFYEKMGYQKCLAFGAYTDNSYNIYFEKTLC